jgi:DNA polymerase-3 subunit delta'
MQGTLPWHDPCWALLRAARAASRLPHALLVTGPTGVGKRQLIERLAHGLLCCRPTESGEACGDCRDCDLWAAGTHPDYLRIGSDPDGQSDEIRVDTVRRSTDAEALTAHRGGFKVIVVDPAQRLNAAAANALLKTLEEPSPGTLLCLICEEPSRLPATVRSRCQLLKVPVPSDDIALTWLQAQGMASKDATKLLGLAHGAPLRALALAGSGQLKGRDNLFSGFAAVGHGTRDPIAEAAGWNQHDPAILLDWLGTWVSDLLRLASGHAAARLINADKAEMLRELSRRIDLRRGHRLFQEILRARAAQDSTLNRLLLYEWLLIEWRRATST